MPSTRSSTSSPSRTAIAVLVLVSLGVPGAVLALIVTHQSSRHAASAPADTPTTTLAPTDAAKAKTGTLAPDFTLNATTGATITLAKLRGHPVVIAFFASWCRPCEEELPVLQGFAHDDTRLRVLGVSFQDLPHDTADFVHRLGITFPALVEDPSGPVASRYGVRGIPQTVFVDGRGVVRGRVYGQTSRNALAPAIDDLLHSRNIRPI